MLSVSVWISTLILICISHWVYRWRNPKCNGKLPPGSMGFPLLGESSQFFKPNTSSDVPPFHRYGPVFKTSLVGRSVIVSTDPEINHFIFQQEGKLFQSWYPDTFTEIFGQQNVGSLHGFMYKYLKNMVLNLFGPESLKEKLLPEMIFDLTAKKLISYTYDPAKHSENLRDNFVAFIQGLISFPLDIPGTAYHKCLQGRKKAMKMLKDMLQERRTMPERKQEDFFDYVLEELKKEGTVLTEAIALDLMFVLLFATFETTSLALTLAIKLLTDNPEVLKELTVCDTEGWAVMVCPPAVHLNPAKYKDPTAFNPRRWEGMEQNGASKHFMAFGGGMRFCVGADFAKVQMAVFLHYLVSEYRWTPIKGGDILRTPIHG